MTFPSGMLIYLFADELIPEKSLFGPDALAPRGGKKVDLKQLVIRAYAAVFMDLVEGGVLELKQLQVRKFLGKETVLAADVRQGTTAPMTDEGKLLITALLKSSKPEEQRVRDVITRVVGGRDSTPTPWHKALEPFIQVAVQDGYVSLPEKRAGFIKQMFNKTVALTRAVSVPEKTEPLRMDALSATNRLEAFLARLGDQGLMLLQEIESGVKACQEQQVVFDA